MHNVLIFLLVNPRRCLRTSILLLASHIGSKTEVYNATLWPENISDAAMWMDKPSSNWIALSPWPVSHVVRRCLSSPTEALSVTVLDPRFRPPLIPTMHWPPAVPQPVTSLLLCYKSHSHAIPESQALFFVIKISSKTKSCICLINWYQEIMPINVSITNFLTNCSIIREICYTDDHHFHNNISYYGPGPIFSYTKHVTPWQCDW